MTPSAPIATIMIPTYGQADVLPRALESALAQTYAPLQVVVADDASPDATPAVVAPYLVDRRLTYVRRVTNLGRTGNYRATLAADAVGDLVLNLDGDDWLLDPEFVARAVELFVERPDLALVFGRAHDYTSRTGYEVTEVNRGLPRFNSGLDLLLAYAAGSVSIPHAAALYRRDLALSAGFYAYDCVGSDTVALLSLLPGNDVGFVDTVAAVWNKHDDNATFRTPPASRLRNDHLVVDVPGRLLRERGGLSAGAIARWKRRMGARWGLSYVEDCVVAGRYAAAARYALAALATRPATGTLLLGTAIGKGAGRLLTRLGAAGAAR